MTKYMVLYKGKKIPNSEHDFPTQAGYFAQGFRSSLRKDGKPVRGCVKVVKVRGGKIKRRKK